MDLMNFYFDRINPDKRDSFILGYCVGRFGASKFFEVTDILIDLAKLKTEIMPPERETKEVYLELFIGNNLHVNLISLYRLNQLSKH